ncbi:hypothetical protein QTO34_014456 [Cnephaeus nilssonii]|uniref:ornithine decarboxylase n=1 Tax=Cnephaeus nilssonii TaxID=3371016 RepID=A0AA40I6E8_CNENI|nr:hypothetical protein QTO34_014456 [Eptesicus nilssonii]
MVPLKQEVRKQEENPEVSRRPFPWRIVADLMLLENVGCGHVILHLQQSTDSCQLETAVFRNVGVGGVGDGEDPTCNPEGDGDRNINEEKIINQLPPTPLDLEPNRDLLVHRTSRNHEHEPLVNEEFDCHFLDEGFTAMDILDQKINEVSSSDDKDALYVADLGDILKKLLKWLKALPRGHRQIIYANPCKQVSQIKYAANKGVQMITFHNKVKLMEVARAHPKANFHMEVAVLTLRPSCWPSLMPTAVFDMGAKVGFNMYLLDIGGGFPGPEDAKLKFEIVSVINPALDKYFPSDLGVILIAEPGRYYVASAFTLAVNITAKKLVLKEQTGSDDEEESGEKTFIYYVNNGVYVSFNCILYDHVHVKSLLQKRTNQMRSIIHPASGGQHVTASIT